MDQLIAALDDGLRTVYGEHRAARPHAGTAHPSPQLSKQESRQSGRLMRVNHVGEVCAQALYTAQSLATPDPRLKAHFHEAARQETDHLVWTRERLRELNDRPSMLNPLWYAGAFALGLVAGRLGDAHSLGFVIETERQVEAHLQSHLDRLPAADTRSRAIVAHMKDDEARHGLQAAQLGGRELPGAVRLLMRAAAKLMTTTAARL